MELCFGQRIDPSNNLIEPWLTNPAMDEIKTWDLKDKKILEYGGGSSTIWWADKAAYVLTIETDPYWCDRIRMIAGNKGLLEKISLFEIICNEGDQTKVEYYTEIPVAYIPDIVVVDGILRYECILKVLAMQRPLTLIVDNWQQDYVFMCPAAEDALKNYEGQFYIQPDHKDHQGRPWQTAIWHLK